MKISTRIANITDLKILRHIAEQTFREAFENNNSSPENFERYSKTAFSASQIRSEIETSGNTFLLAENDNGEAVGYGKLRTDNRRKNLLEGRDAIEIERIYALKKHWGKGVGKALMLSLIHI